MEIRPRPPGIVVAVSAVFHKSTERPPPPRLESVKIGARYRRAAGVRW